MKFKIVGKRYFKLSDIKATGVCLNCGNKLSGRQKKYCCDKCFQEFYDNHHWQSFRRMIFKKRKNTCEICNKKIEEFYRDYGILEIHHKCQIKNGGELCDENNVLLVCKDCHKKLHKKRKDLLAFWENKKCS